MNIKDFLIENYVYIIVVIVLIIITIIGFLADKKKTGEKKPKTLTGKIQPVENAPISGSIPVTNQYQQNPQMQGNYQQMGMNSMNPVGQVNGVQTPVASQVQNSNGTLVGGNNTVTSATSPVQAQPVMMSQPANMAVNNMISPPSYNQVMQNQMINSFNNQNVPQPVVNSAQPAMGQSGAINSGNVYNNCVSNTGTNPTPISNPVPIPVVPNQNQMVRPMPANPAMQSVPSPMPNPYANVQNNQMTQVQNTVPYGQTVPNQNISNYGNK